MKKQLTLILCCLTFFISGIAQPQMQKAEFFEKFNKKHNFGKESPMLSQKQTVLSKMHIPEKSLKSTDWWEPDTIYVYSTDSPDERYIFLYENSKCTVNLMQFRSGTQWIDSLKNTNLYDSQNNLLYTLYQSWESGKWNNVEKGTYTYDSPNNMTYIYQLWQSGEWENVRKGNYTYDSNHNVKEEIWQNWNEEWVNEERCIYSYDSQNNLKESIYQVWESDNWENSGHELYTYNEQNAFSIILYQIWDNAQWLDEALQTYYYNDLNQCTLCIFQYWSDNQWINSDKIILTYDEHNNQTSEIWQYWEDKWINSDKSVSSYDENNNATAGFAQYWSGNTWVDGNGDLYVYYNNMQSFNLIMYGQRFTATYIKQNHNEIKENNLFNNSVTLYPNPVSNMLHIEANNQNIIPEVKIYSIQGALLAHSKGYQVDVSSLPNGIYIVNVNGVCRKVVKW